MKLPLFLFAPFYLALPVLGSVSLGDGFDENRIIFEGGEDVDNDNQSRQKEGAVLQSVNNSDVQQLTLLEEKSENAGR